MNGAIKFSKTPVALLMAVIAVSCSAAACESEHIMHAIDQHDYEMLKTIACDADGAVEWTMLSKAIVQSMLGNDENAEVALLELVATSNVTAIDARALRSLSGVMVRQGRFSEAAAAMSQVIELNSDGVTIDDQTVAAFTALATVRPMQAIVNSKGEVEAHRDKANLLRLPIEVNGTQDDAVFDTGAAFSTVTVSMANKMRLRQLGAEIEIAGSTHNTVQSGLAVANELVIGSARFVDVPFIVVPDDALVFPEFDYSITSILGLPVIASLGRVELSSGANSETIAFEKTNARADSATANMITSGWQVVALANLSDSPTRSRFFLDTGARQSALYAFAGVTMPTLLNGVTSTSRRAGGLGDLTEEETFVVPSLTMAIGKREIEIGPIDMRPDDGSFRHGEIGQDILTRFSRVVLDFDAMRLSVSD